MDRFSRQRGQINAGCFIALFLVVIVVIIATKTVPVIVEIGDLQKQIELLAERASLSTYTDKKIEGRIYQKAEELGLPVKPGNIKIQRTSQEIHIVVEYDVSIDFPGYTYRWHKVHDVRRPLF